MNSRPSAMQLAESALSDAMRQLESMGPVEIIDGHLTAGGTVPNGSTELVDSIKKKYGFGCSIFQGNIRVSTNARAAGKEGRALGTSANSLIRRSRRLHILTRVAR